MHWRTQWVASRWYVQHRRVSYVHCQHIFIILKETIGSAAVGEWPCYQKRITLKCWKSGSMFFLVSETASNITEQRKAGWKFCPLPNAQRQTKRKRLQISSCYTFACARDTISLHMFLKLRISVLSRFTTYLFLPSWQMPFPLLHLHLWTFAPPGVM